MDQVGQQPGVNRSLNCPQLYISDSVHASQIRHIRHGRPLASTRALWPSKVSKTSLRWCRAATWRAVRPSLFATCTEYFWSINDWINSRWPVYKTWILIPIFVVCILLCDYKGYFQLPYSPFCAAKCIGRFPSRSARLMAILWLERTANISAWPLAAAKWASVLPCYRGRRERVSRYQRMVNGGKFVHCSGLL